MNSYKHDQVKLLSNMVLHDVDNFMQEVLLKIMQKDFHVMLDDLRGVKEKIDDLDSEISTWDILWIFIVKMKYFRQTCQYPSY